MFVPSYIPPQIEIPDNVSEVSYSARLGFVRRVIALHAAAVGVAALVSAAPLPPVPIRSAGMAVLAILASMSLVRVLARGRRIEVHLSAGMLVPFLAALGWFSRELASDGLPLWPFAASLGMAHAYGLLCGRDFSFVAMFVLPWMGTLALWSIGRPMGWIIGWDSPLGLTLSTALLFYFVHDFAALLTRRRLGEELGAVADLFRDVLNFTTYGWRVARHWKRYPIWQR